MASEKDKKELTEFFTERVRTFKMKISELINGELEDGDPARRILETRALLCALGFHVGSVEELLKLYMQGVADVEQKIQKEFGEYKAFGCNTAREMISEQLKSHTN